LEERISMAILAEQPEWNALFLCVIETHTAHCPELAHVAPQVRHHLRYLENSLAAIMSDKDWLDAIQVFPPGWQKGILIVEDEAQIAARLETLLSWGGRLQTAADGSAALCPIEQQYFAVIISDADMPVLDGGPL
jgi:PleD family two-component response regulator